MKPVTLPLETLMEYVTCEFVGGELIATVEGKRISVGRKKNGMFTYSLHPHTQELLARVKAELKPIPTKAPPKRRKAEVVTVEAQPVPAPARRGRPKKAAIDAKTESSEL